MTMTMTMTTEQVHAVIMKAAAQIGRHPETFLWEATKIPSGCGTPGCALGWIGHFAQLLCADGSFNFLNVPRRVLGIAPSWDDEFGDETFYHRMDALCRRGAFWQKSSSMCAAALRLYAAKYHPLPKEPAFLTELKALAAAAELAT